MSFAKVDKWTGHEYLAVESDLLVNGNRYLQVDNNANITTVNSISFIIEANALTGQFFNRGTAIITVGDLNLTIGQKTHIVYSGNGRIYKNSQDVGSHALNFSQAANVQIGNGGSNDEDFTVSHFACFDSNLTQGEVSHIDDIGGGMPDSVKDNCVAYYPLTERYGYDDTVFFRFFDCVEQYNIKKGSNLTANHAKAFNYTASELGTVNPQLTTHKKDFYKKERNYWGMLDFKNYRTLISKIVGGVFNPLDGTNEDFTLTFEGLPTIGVNAAYYFFEFGSTFRLGFGLNSGIYPVMQVYFDNGASKLDSIMDGANGIPAIKVTDKKNHIWQVKRLSTDLQFWVDGVMVANTGAFQDEGTIFATDRIQLFMDRGPAVKTSARVKRIVFAQGDVSLDDFLTSTYPSNVFVDLNFNKINGTSMEDEGLFGTLSFRTDVTQADAAYIPESSLLKGGGAWIDSTLLPVTTQGLNIATGKQVSGSYTSINGIVISYRGAANITAITDIITGLPAINRILVNGVVEANILNAFNDGNIVDVTLEFSAPFTGSINFVHTGVDYNISRVGTINDTLEFKEALELANNSLLANPSIGLQDKFVNYHLFNTGNISATPDNPDLIGAVALTLTGWVDQADVQSNIVDLNTLR